MLGLSRWLWGGGGGGGGIYTLYCIMSVPDAGPVQQAGYSRTALLTAAVRGLKHNTTGHNFPPKQPSKIGP
jgi:hypothetical protein